MTFAPARARSVITGNDARIRPSSVTFPSSSGTLRSDRTITARPAADGRRSRIVWAVINILFGSRQYGQADDCGRYHLSHVRGSFLLKTQGIFCRMAKDPLNIKVGATGRTGLRSYYGLTRPAAPERAASKRAWTSAQLTMFQMALT